MASLVAFPFNIPMKKKSLFLLKKMDPHGAFPPYFSNFKLMTSAQKELGRGVVTNTRIDMWVAWIVVLCRCKKKKPAKPKPENHPVPGRPVFLPGEGIFPMLLDHRPRPSREEAEDEQGCPVATGPVWPMTCQKTGMQRARFVSENRYTFYGNY